MLFAIYTSHGIVKNMKVFLASSINAPGIPKHLSKSMVRYVVDTYQTFHYERDLSRADENLTFDMLVQEIAAADVFIAEMSYASQTLGFQLAHALRTGRQCLYLYDPSIKGQPKGMIGNITSRNLKIKEYNDTNYKKVVDSFMKFAEKQQQSYRTSFMITREIDEFISIRSKKLMLSRGEVIRELLHKAAQDYML